MRADRGGVRRRSAATAAQAQNGTRVSLSWLPFGPYFLLNAAAFHAYRLLARGPAYAEVVPNLILARRLSPRETVAVGCVAVLDLAAEFAATRWSHSIAYLSLPLLDATAPTPTQLQTALDWIATHITRGPVVVHCALGHDRSACVAAAYLSMSRAVVTPGEPERRLRELRPGVRLNPTQRRALRQFCDDFGEPKLI